MCHTSNHRMVIAFATALSSRSSTIIGRVAPLAREFSREHDVHLLLLSDSSSKRPNVGTAHFIGQEPFTRTASGKQRLRGLPLIANMLSSARQTFRTLRQLKPDVVILVKPLPSNTLGVRFWSLNKPSQSTIILDTDDFELTANQLSSLTQRAAIQWSERAAARMSSAIVAATPFLADHFEQLTQHRQPVKCIPTGLTLNLPEITGSTTPPTISYFGSVSISSGHRVDLLPEMLAYLQRTHPDARLLIAGDGDDVAELKNKFQQQNLQDAVTWHGRFVLDELAELLNQTTILIDPVDASIAQRAKSSFRVALATLAGLPVVTSNVGIRPHLVPQVLHRRFFAGPANPTAYARQINNLLELPLTASEQQLLKNHAQHYTWVKLADQYSRIIKKVQ